MSRNMIYVSSDFDDASYNRCALNQRIAAVNLGKRGQTLWCF